ncbi:MAG: hypothetical protein AAFQ22_03240 [Pseudomonadota bacterium]
MSEQTNLVEVSGWRLRFARNVGGLLFLIGLTGPAVAGAWSGAFQILFGLGAGAFLTALLLDTRPSIWDYFQS